MPVLQWCHPQFFLEGAAKDTFAGKACTEADVFDGKSGVFQQIFCSVQADIYQVFMRGEPGFFPETADKMVGA